MVGGPLQGGRQRGRDFRPDLRGLTTNLGRDKNDLFERIRIRTSLRLRVCGGATRVVHQRSLLSKEATNPQPEAGVCGIRLFPFIRWDQHVVPSETRKDSGPVVSDLMTSCGPSWDSAKRIEI
jgi:hypothetical protein